MPEHAGAQPTRAFRDTDKLTSVYGMPKMVMTCTSQQQAFHKVFNK